ncbi:hypothetical protein [Pseudomonas sp. SWI44]|nr:hypothetical protein [Pseudomonas sp. SWI44]
MPKIVVSVAIKISGKMSQKGADFVGMVGVSTVCAVIILVAFSLTFLD